MIIKKFQGKTEEEATELAKKELGDSVVVMNVRNVKRAGFFSFLFPSVVEVTVGKEEEVSLPETKSLKSSIPDKTPSIDLKADEDVTPVQKFSIFTPDIIAKTEASISEAREKESKEKEIKEKEIKEKEINEKEPKWSSQKGLVKNSDEHEWVSESRTLEKLDSLQILLEKQLGRDSVDALSKEKEDNRETEKEDKNVAFLKLLYNTMIENEVDERFANQIFDEFDKDKVKNKPMDFVLSNIYQKLILKFGSSVGISPQTEGAKVVFFVGPTGVGKTTTIAKIASKFSVDEKKKIALITADTYRIAAAEQLRTYANILDVPFRVIYSRDELMQALDDFKSCDYILVDTAGHSHKNEEQKDAMVSLVCDFPDKREKEVFLVLSATTKYRDLISIADAYSNMTNYKLIFTKLDETTTYGNLLNIRMHTGAPLSYVTSGQNVPDDIENFNPQKIVKALLGGKIN